MFDNLNRLNGFFNLMEDSVELKNTMIELMAEDLAKLVDFPKKDVIWFFKELAKIELEK